MAEWIYEEGIGEDRAILVDEGEIVEARIELPGKVQTGSVLAARLTAILVPGRRGIVMLDRGGEALLEPLPAQITEGARLRVEITREAIPEAGRAKLPKARATDDVEREAPGFAQRLEATGHKVVKASATGPDLFEQAGWSELLEEA